MMKRKREYHGESKTDLYSRWSSMRCRVSPKWKYRDHYYDRGIIVCEEWDSFLAFKEWALENGYRKDLELDRIDNDKGYSPDNCRFVDRLTNNSNRSNTIMVPYEGEMVSLTIMSEKLGLSRREYNTIRRRIMNGWDGEKALNTPVTKGRYGHSGTIKVVDMNTNRVYDSLKDAAMEFGISPSKLSEMLIGSRNNSTSLQYA
ncbi:hypothetical protein [Parapedobacter lycopersici]|uniref:hypothetical protein n=1 Tax=Parapedobacter lycopersici TaxID=1864939 RepID=UPI00214DC79E|nr:hypothetical protein [Parapedobacter lycopersici]